MNACEWVPAHIRAIAPYQPGKPIAELARELGLVEHDIVKLASNENPLGASPMARIAAQAAMDALHLYPDGSGYALKQALAARLAIEPAAITLGNGSNDVLVLIAETLLTHNDEAVVSAHCFAVYPLAVQAAGAMLRVAPAHDGARGPQGAHDLDAMRALINERTRLVYIANPNNPTGGYLAAEALQAFLDSLPRGVVTVVDEAYFEYVEQTDYPDCVRWLPRYPQLVVTRTFSKAYGLAGLRVGYALSSPELAELFNRVRQPFNVNALALSAATAALADAAHIVRSRRSTATGRAQLAQGLDALGLKCLPSVGNFLCVDMGGAAAPVFQALLRRGVIVRPIANYGLPNHLRITVGTAAQNKRCLDALDCVLRG